MTWFCSSFLKDIFFGYRTMCCGFLNFYLFFGCAGSSLLHGLLSICRDWDYSVVGVHGLLIVVAPLCCGAWPLGHAGFSGCGTRAQQFSTLEHRLSGCGTWALVAPQHVGSSRIRMEPVTPVWAGGFFTTEPPGKPRIPCWSFLSALKTIVPFTSGLYGFFLPFFFP